jgi:hypothetical protein
MDDMAIIEAALAVAPRRYRDGYVGEVWERLQELKSQVGMIKALRNYVRHIHGTNMRAMADPAAMLAACRDEESRRMVELAMIEKLPLERVAAEVGKSKSVVAHRLQRLRARTCKNSSETAAIAP